MGTKLERKQTHTHKHSNQIEAPPPVLWSTATYNNHKEDTILCLRSILKKKSMLVVYWAFISNVSTFTAIAVTSVSPSGQKFVSKDRAQTVFKMKQLIKASAAIWTGSSLSWFDRNST